MQLTVESAADLAERLDRTRSSRRRTAKPGYQPFRQGVVAALPHCSDLVAIAEVVHHA